MVEAEQKKTAPKAVKKKGGRPAWTPTEFQKGEVSAAIRFGQPEAEIAAELGIDPKTLRRHFRHELDFGKIRYLRSVATSLGRMALGAPAQFDAKGNMIRAEVLPDKGAACFILKTQAKEYGYVERQEMTGAGGAPIPVKVTGGLPD